jgi:hypothetical protein
VATIAAQQGGVDGVAGALHRVAYLPDPLAIPAGDISDRQHPPLRAQVQAADAARPALNSEG